MQKDIKGILTQKVRLDQSALNMGSGTLEVFSTPSLVAFVEKTCWMSIDEFLEEGQTTVGTKMELSHLKATPIGFNVTCHSNLLEVDGAKLVFEFEVTDEKELISKGRHERFIVDKEKFQNKVDSKKEKPEING
ncbi:MAG: thioesterase family protein [Tissierellia bacterium]|nr:thioesterase family protein [Tissierellia bacterium]